MQQPPPQRQIALPRRIRPHNPPGSLLLTPPLPLSLHQIVSNYTHLPLTTLRPFTTSTFFSLSCCVARLLPWLSYVLSSLFKKLSHICLASSSASFHLSGLSFISPQVLPQSFSPQIIGIRVRRRGAKSTAGSVIRVITPARCVCLPDGFLYHRV